MQKHYFHSVRHFFFSFSVCCAFLFLFAQRGQAQRIVGYFPSYSGAFIDNVKFSCLTDVFYAFAIVDASGNVTIQNLTTFNAVKAKCKPMDPAGPNLWLSVGGAGQSGNFATVAGNSTALSNFASQCNTLCNTHNMVGIDLDWEFPTTSQVTLHENMMSALNTALGTKLLCMAVGGEYTGTIRHTDYCSTAAMGFCDYINIMTYDFPASYNADHSTLANSQASVIAWNEKAGNTSMHKFCLGIPFYGRPSPRNGNDTRKYDALSGPEQTNVLTSGTSNGYYFNTTATLNAKVDWIMGQGGSGVLIWDVCQDNVTQTLQTIICNRMATACPTPTPNLGADAGICGSNSITIGDATINATGRTFAWLKNGSSYPGTTRTISVNTPGTYRLTVTQGTCSRSDEITVIQSQTVTATGASRCGTGTVTLNATGPGGTYEWYDAASGGNKLGTGAAFTTPSISATTNYYVQQSTGSVTNYTGKPTINVAGAWNEFASDANPGTKPQHAHKFTALQSLTIQSVTIYTSGVARSGAKLMVYNTTTGNLMYQSAAINIPAMTAGTPYTFNANLAIPTGTYYIGIYVPSTNAGNASIWLEPSYAVTTPFTVAGICSMEARSYSGNFLATQTPIHYGQLFNWVITTGVVNPCARTMVTATIGGGPAAPTGFTGPMTPCVGTGNHVYSVTNVANTTYTWTYSGTGATITAGTGTNSITVSYSGTATNGTWSVTATVSGCTGVAFTSGTVTLGTAPATPGTITGSGAVTQGSSGNAYSITAVSGATSYTWSYSGTGATITNGTTPSATIAFSGTATSGTLSVTATNSCGTSSARTTSITVSPATSIDLGNSDKLEAFVKPNPFEDNGKLVIATPKNVTVSAVLYDVIGNEKAAILSNISISAGEHTYEIPDNLAPGMYIIRVEAEKQSKAIRIIKTK